MSYLSLERARLSNCKRSCLKALVIAAAAAPLTGQVEIRDLRVINLMIRSLKDLEIFFRPFLARKRATKKSLLHSSSKISSYTNLHLNNRSLKAAIKNRSLYSSNFLHNLK